MEPKGLESGLRVVTGDAAWIESAPVVPLVVSGDDRVDLLHRLSTNDLRGIGDGGIVRTLLLSDKGRILDLVTVASLGDRVILLVSRGNEDRVIDWLAKYTITEDFKVQKVSHQNEVGCIVGPNSVDRASRSFREQLIPGTVTLFREGSTEAALMPVSARWGAEVYVVPLGEFSVHSPALRGGEEIPVIGREVWEAFRISRVQPAYSSELSEHFNPYDVGLTEFVSYTKGCYIGQEVVARIDTYQKARKAIMGVVSGVVLKDAHGKPPLFKDEEEVGVLTSGTSFLVAGRAFGLAVARTDAVSVGDMLAVGEADSDVRVRVVPAPIEISLS